MEVAPASECSAVSGILGTLADEMLALEQLCRNGNCEPLRAICSHRYPSENSVLQAVSQTYPRGFAECMAEYHGLGPQVANVWATQDKACRLLSEVGIRSPILYERAPERSAFRLTHNRHSSKGRKNKKRQKRRRRVAGILLLLVVVALLVCRSYTSSRPS